VLVAAVALAGSGYTVWREIRGATFGLLWTGDHVLVP